VKTKLFEYSWIGFLAITTKLFDEYSWIGFLAITIGLIVILVIGVLNEWFDSPVPNKR
jgi:hypothetical protein